MKDKRNNTGEGTTGETKRQTLRVQPAAVLPAARPAEVKFTGSCRQYSEPGLHRRFGGACMHKTDGKLFCVAAPIPGAGAGGKGGGGPRDGRQHRVNQMLPVNSGEGKN